MKTLLKKFGVSLVALTLVFAMFSGFGAAALPKDNTVKAFDQEWEILEDEVYGCYEILQECVEDFEPEDYEEVDMDDKPWYFNLEIDKDWWYATTYFYYADGPVEDNFACIGPKSLDSYPKPGDEKYEEIVANRIANYASSVALDKVDERLAVTTRGPWSKNNGQAKFVFVAPKTGKVVLYNEGLIEAATKDSPFSAFGDPVSSGTVEVCIKKNDTIISEIVKISVDSPTAEFPKAGKTGCFKVFEGDEIEINVKAYDNISENNTIFLDPVVAYTEVEEPKVKPQENVNKDDDTNKDNNSDAPNVMPIIIIVVGVIVVAVVLILVLKKKRVSSVNNKSVSDDISNKSEDNKNE